MVTSIIGTFIIFRSLFETVVSRLASLELRPWPTVEKPADHKLLPLDTLLDAARARHGDKPLVALRFPFADSSVVITYAVPANANRPRATDQTWINGYTAGILATHDAAALSLRRIFSRCSARCARRILLRRPIFPAVLPCICFISPYAGEPLRRENIEKQIPVRRYFHAILIAKSFVDTNVVLYTIGSDTRKKQIARSIVATRPALR